MSSPLDVSLVPELVEDCLFEKIEARNEKLDFRNVHPFTFHFPTQTRVSLVPERIEG